MNRVIKFRAWDAKERVMVYSTGLHQILYGGAGDDIALGIQLPSSVKHGRSLRTEVDAGTIVFMQFTGLLDSEGRQIFEGDVVEVRGTEKAVVTFDNGCFYTKIKTSPYRLGGWKAGTIKVVGNVYENPDLLKST